MKKHWYLIFTIVNFIGMYICCWYSDYLFDTFFIVGLIPLLVFFLAEVIFFFIGLGRLRKKYKVVDLVCIILIIINLVSILFIPFRDIRARLEFLLYFDERNEVIDIIKENKDNIGIVKLEDKYKKVSNSGDVFVYYNDKETVVGFYVFRGMMSSTTQVVYSSGGKYFVMYNQNGSKPKKIKELNKNWYYVIYE